MWILKGEGIREFRKQKGMTLTELAEKSGFTASYLSQLERDIIEPSLTALRKICIVLEVPIYYFLSDAEDAQSTIIRKEERQKLALPKTSVVYEFLTPMGLDQNIKPKMEIIHIEIKPKKWSSEEYFSHNADECIIIMKGNIEVALDNEKVILNEGDSMYIIQNVKHKYFNPTDEKSYLISIICPPIY